MVLKKVAFLMLVAVVNVVGLHAQVVLPQKGQERDLHDNVFGLGLFGGAGTGLGISFRHHLPSLLSYQITGGIIKANETLSYDIGGEGQYDLVRGSSNRFFVGGGLGYYYSGKSENELEAPGRLCVGLGGEFAMAPGIHGTVELMFTYFTNGNVLPLPQVGFHYYFY